MKRYNWGDINDSHTSGKDFTWLMAYLQEYK